MNSATHAEISVHLMSSRRTPVGDFARFARRRSPLVWVRCAAAALGGIAAPSPLTDISKPSPASITTSPRDRLRARLLQHRTTTCPPPRASQAPPRQTQVRTRATSAIDAAADRTQSLNQRLRRVNHRNAQRQIVARTEFEHHVLRGDQITGITRADPDEAKQNGILILGEHQRNRRTRPQQQRRHEDRL